MKRLYILVFVMLFVFVSAAFTNEIRFLGFHVPPTIIEDVSFYDYMPGGYNGFPMQLQGESSFLETGIYFTYMLQASALAERVQYFAFGWRDPIPGAQVLHRQKITNVTAREGFGTLQVVPNNESVIFTWHSSVPGTGNTNVYFTWDAFSEAEYPGWGLYERAILKNNISAEATARRHDFSWPVILIGPSPKQNHHRVYVFMSNVGRSLLETPPGSQETHYPSSNHFVMFTDVNNSTFAGESPESLVWTERYVPYLERLHNWAPINPKDPDDTDSRWFARGYFSYAVASAGPYSGHVAIAGQISGDTDQEWSGHDLHDHIVLLATDYLEGEDRSAGTDLPYGVFREYPFNLTRIEDDIQGPMRFNPDEVAQLPPDVQNYIHDTMYSSANNFFYQTEWREQRMRSVLTTQKTLTFDKIGRLHIPSIGNAWWSTIVNEPGYGHSYSYSFTIQNLIFDLNAETMMINNVYPKAYNELGQVVQSDIFLFPWDMNNDGWVDLHYDAEENSLSHFTANYPYNHHSEEDDHAVDFHQNQTRLSIENDGLIAMMWIDGMKAKIEESQSGSYPAYLANPEIMIALSADSGDTWSFPYAISVVNHPEIGTAAGSLAYIYPADKVLYVDGNTARVYFMYMDDNSWGCFAIGGSNPLGMNAGGSIRYAAVDFDISEINKVVSENNREIPVALNMLSQNFPNPFNPNTTIKFDLPANSDVKLSVYNVRGQLVNTLINESLIAGPHEVNWNGTDNNNRSVSSGIYFYRIEANGHTETKRMILMK